MDTGRSERMDQCPGGEGQQEPVDDLFLAYAPRGRPLTQIVGIICSVVFDAFLFSTSLPAN